MEETQSLPLMDDDRTHESAKSLRAFRKQAEEMLASNRKRLSDIESRVSEQLEKIAEELRHERLDDGAAVADSTEQTEVLQQLRQTLAEKEAEVEEILEQLGNQSLLFDTQIAERDDELEQLLKLCEEETHQRNLIEQELDSTKQALLSLEAQECEACAFAQNALSTTKQELAQAKTQQEEIQEQYKKQQIDLEETQQAVQSAQQAHEQASAQLAEAEQRNAELTELIQDHEDCSSQLEQIQRKFELALEDAHKLKRENAELHEELLSRPAANDQESPELVSLRAERDALAERVANLEVAPQAADSADTSQELEDLQRRFELAVDDVRRFKQENADLRQRLETAPAGADSQDELQDWQSQKARLLATLDAEDQGAFDDQRREQRATIEGTLAITDRVVAEKDALFMKLEAEIHDLRAQLESKPKTEDADALREQITAEILSNEELIQTELTKLRQQQSQLDAKLREAELKISVERATLAREQAALGEKLAELSDREAETSGEQSSPGKPRRRWLSALGIKEEEDT